MSDPDDSNPRLKPDRNIAEERQRLGKKELARILVVRGMDQQAAEEAASEIMDAGFCIVGGGVPM